MEIKFTVKIKDKHNPPVFDKKLGKGVIETQVVEFKGAKAKDVKTPSFQRQVMEYAEELKNDWLEIIIEKQKPCVKKSTKKK